MVNGNNADVMRELEELYLWVPHSSDITALNLPPISAGVGAGVRQSRPISPSVSEEPGNSRWRCSSPAAGLGQAARAALEPRELLGETPDVPGPTEGTPHLPLPSGKGSGELTCPEHRGHF